MHAKSKFKGELSLLLLVAALLPGEASAVSVEVAKKCNTLLAKEFPPREIGNPAAGSTKGNPQAERDFFKKCVENGGNMDNSTDKTPK